MSSLFCNSNNLLTITDCNLFVYSETRIYLKYIKVFPIYYFPLLRRVCIEIHRMTFCFNVCIHILIHSFFSTSWYVLVNNDYMGTSRRSSKYAGCLGNFHNLFSIKWSYKWWTLANYHKNRHLQALRLRISRNIQLD